MPRSQLTSFEHALLGMIFTQPASGYDLKRRFATSPMGVYQPSSGALYPALQRLERRGLLRSDALQPTAGGRPRRVYELTAAGRAAHLAWVHEPVRPESVSQDLSTHMLRFAMMADVLPPEDVVGFLTSLRAALAEFVTTLEQVSADPELGKNLTARLAVRHGLAVYQASVTWAEQAIAALNERSAAD